MKKELGFTFQSASPPDFPPSLSASRPLFRFASVYVSTWLRERRPSRCRNGFKIGADEAGGRWCLCGLPIPMGGARAGLELAVAVWMSRPVERLLVTWVEPAVGGGWKGGSVGSAAIYGTVLW